MEVDDSLYHSMDTDLDLSFTSTTSTSDRTFRSSLTISFTDRLSPSSTSSSSTTTPTLPRPHRRSDPHWSAIKSSSTLSGDGRLHLRHLKLLRHLGTGNLGRVFLCHLTDSHPSDPTSHFALKVVDKDSLSPKKLSHVETEAHILSLLDHPFLPTLYAHLDVSHYTCLLIDYCPGGDLHSLLRKQPGNRLPVQAVKFYAAEVLVAMEYLHSLGIVYRDLKPENILIREDGHIMLSDFDLCFKSHISPKLERVFDRKVRTGFEFVAEPTSAFSKSCVGTHEYLAPELVSGAGHGNGVDWWAFGVLIFELLYGTTPFKGASKEATLRNIASRREVGFFFHVEEREREEDLAVDLIAKLLVKDPRRRMGAARGAAEVKRHPFFSGIKWPLILSYRPPELRGGVVVRRSRSHVRRRRWWRGLGCFLKKKVSSSSSLSSYSSSPSYSSSLSSSKGLLNNYSFKSMVSVNSDKVISGK